MEINSISKKSQVRILYLIISILVISVIYVIAQDYGVFPGGPGNETTNKTINITIEPPKPIIATHQISTETKINAEDFDVNFNSSKDGLEVKVKDQKDKNKEELVDLQFYYEGTLKEKIKSDLKNINVPIVRLSNSSWKYNITIPEVSKESSNIKYLVINISSKLEIENDSTKISLYGEDYAIIMDFSDIKGFNYLIEKNQIKIDIAGITTIDIDPTITFTTEQVESIAVAPLSNNTFVVAWCDEVSNDATFQVFYTNGANITNPVDVDTDVGSCNMNAVSVSAFNSTAFVIGWQDLTDEDATFRVYSSDGTNLTAPIDADTAMGYESFGVVVSTLNSTTFVITWADSTLNEATFKVYLSNGTNITNSIVYDSSNGKPYTVSVSALNSTSFVVGWYDNNDNDITFRVYSSDGTNLTAPIDADTDVNYDFSGIPNGISVSAFDSTSFVIGWYDATDNDFSFATYWSNGTNITNIIDTDISAGTGKSVSVSAQNSTNFVMGWFDQTDSDASFSLWLKNGTNLTDQIDSATTALDYQAVASYSAATGIGFCNQAFVHAYVNSTSAASFTTYYANGTIWNGICNPPVITLINPLNNSNINKHSLEFNVSLSTTVNSCSLSINSGTAVTMTINSSLTGANYTNSSIADGTYNFSISCTNTLNEASTTGLNYFNIDTVYPLINFTAPTPANGTTTTNTSIIMNLSINEANLNEVTWNWNGTNFTMYNDSLVVMYNFENLSALGENGIRVVDLSKYSNNGTPIGGAIYTSSGKYGGAYSFDGVNDYINVTGISASSNYTLVAWVKTGDTGQQTIMDFETGRAILGPGGSNNLSYYDGNSWLNSNLTVNNNQWHFITAVKNSGVNVILYVDSVSQTFTTSTTNSIGGRATIGAQYTLAAIPFWNGTIDEVQIWNRSLSAAEVYQLYASNLYKFNSTQWYLYVNQSKNATTGLDYTNYTYQAFAKDTIGYTNVTETRTITIGSAADTIYPIFSNNQTSLPNNTEYAPSKSWQFNITLVNTNGTAGIQFNGANYTLSNSSSVFNKTFSDLSTGTYTYYYWAYGNGSANNFNTSQTYSYTIAQNSSLVLGLTATTPIIYPTTTDFTGLGCPTQLSCSLNISNDVYGAGTISANYSTVGNANYTAKSAVFTVTINQNTSAVIYTYLNQSRSNLTIYNNTAIWLNVTLFNVSGTIYLYKNNTLINSGVSPLSNLTTFNGALGLYNITSIYPANTNYSGSLETWWINVTLLNSCTCPTINTNWAIDLSNFCIINTDCNIGTGNITFTATGNITFAANITAKSIGNLPANQRGYLKNLAHILVG